MKGAKEGKRSGRDNKKKVEAKVKDVWKGWKRVEMCKGNGRRGGKVEVEGWSCCCTSSSDCRQRIGSLL